MAMLEPRPWQQSRAKTRLVPEVNNPIDRLAAMREQLRKLEKDEQELAKVVAAMGDGEHDGDKVRAVISTTSPERLDVEAIRAEMPEDWIKRFTKSKPQTTVRFKPLV
jgi:hypothetical protein